MRATVILALLLVVAVAAVSACGGSGSNDKATASAGGTKGELSGKLNLWLIDDRARMTTAIWASTSARQST